MTCPSCRSSLTKVVDSRCFDGKAIMRRRTCGCGSRWSTEEKVVRGSITTSPTTIGSEGLRPVASPSDPSLAVAIPVDSVSPSPPSENLSLFLAPDPERAIPPPDPVLLVFPCDGAPDKFEVTESLRASHAEAFPALNIIGEYRKALVWIQAAPANRKTAGGMARFLFRWLGSAQNGGVARARQAQPVEHGRPLPPEVKPPPMTPPAARGWNGGTR